MRRQRAAVLHRQFVRGAPDLRRQRCRGGLRLREDLQRERVRSRRRAAGAPALTGACPSGERCCSGGSCVCDSTSCNGCCSAGQCNAGTQTSACGTGGNACTACMAGAACSQGQRMSQNPNATTVVFGGDNGTVLGDTWTFDGTTFTLLGPSPAPTPRYDHNAVALSGNVVLFGGEGASGGLLNDTWTFHGGSWTPVTTATAPVARYDHGMAGLGGRVILFGGYGASGYPQWTHGVS